MVNYNLVKIFFVKILLPLDRMLMQQGFALSPPLDSLKKSNKSLIILLLKFIKVASSSFSNGITSILSFHNHFSILTWLLLFAAIFDIPSPSQNEPLSLARLAIPSRKTEANGKLALKEFR